MSKPLSVVAQFYELDRLTSRADISPKELVDRLDANPVLKKMWLDFVKREEAKKCRRFLVLN